MALPQDTIGRWRDRAAAHDPEHTDVSRRYRPAIRLPAPVAAPRKVASTTFARAVALFGRKTLVELVALIGNYAATAALLTAFDMQLDPGQKPLLPSR
jgi:hypothetical protein